MLLCVTCVLSLTNTYATGEIIFTSVNDQLLELTAGTMPVRKNGTIYVPYKVFTSEPNGRSPFDVTAAHNSTTQTLVLYNLDHTLTFQIAHGYAYDEKMNSYSQPAYYINGTVYVPVPLVANKFGLSYSFIPSSATILRITNSKANLSDDTFAYVAEIDNALERKIQEYKNSLNPSKNNSSGNTQPATENKDNENTDSKEEIRPSAVYLTFEGALGSNTSAILNALDHYSRRATFFVDTENLNAQGDLIRRIAGEGHSLGLCVSMGHIGSPKELTKALNQANGILSENCGLTTRLVRISGGSKDQLGTDYRDALIAAGYRLWDYTLDTGDTKRGAASKRISNAVLNTFKNSTMPAIVRFGEADATAPALKRILSYMQEHAIYSTVILESDSPVNFYKELR